ncbi:MAG TPA: PQQ-binding-like beta-propeller repeat protein [Gemmatimonadaceae bacterium]|nr:PQQ-binding-like beta-propeller repeat protein [Gemmatimonadaceae bacterium]
MLNDLLLVGRSVALGALLGAACGRDPVQPGEAHVRERWFIPQSKGFPNPRPVVSGATVFFASGSGYVIARDVETGDPKWSTQIGTSVYSVSSEIFGENFILRGGILVTAVQFHTSALDASTGRELWRYEASPDTVEDANPRPGYVQRARIDADDQTVFIPAWGASVSAVDLQTGRARWVWRVEPTLGHRSGAMGVRLSGDTVFATVWHSLNQTGTQGEAWLLALDRLTGAELWRVVLPKIGSGTTVNDAPALWHNLVYVTLTSGDLFAVDRGSQQVAWHIPTQLPLSNVGTALITGPEVYGDFVYANGSDMKLHAYRALDGVEVWSSDGSQFDRDLLVTSKFVYASDGATLYMFDRATGQRYAALGHPRKSYDYIFSSPAAIDGNRLFVTLSDGAWSFFEP